MTQKSRALVLIALVGALFYTRFVNLAWGLPYPFHPDERNMADALMQLHCSGFNTECFNPHFFAYGQLPLYLGYAGIWLYHLIVGSFSPQITFIEATMSLRFISALASILTFIVMIRVTELLIPKLERNHLIYLGLGLFFIFSPGLIQFAHFGTTESLLMLFYTTLVYLGLLSLNKKLSLIKFALLSGLVTGLAVATKVSSISFLSVPIAVVVYQNFLKRTRVGYLSVIFLGVVTAITVCVLSPFNLIDFHDFQSSIQYESAVGIGKTLVFYTRQFAMTTPITFQFTSIFPYALGLTTTILFAGSLFLLPNKKEYNFLRFAFLVYFLPTAFLFTKWTRFVAPLFPLMLIMTALLVLKVLNDVQKRMKFKDSPTQYLFLILMIIAIIPGILFLNIYITQDVRITASEWIYNHIPSNSIILSEGGNVVDLPMASPDQFKNPTSLPTYRLVNFNFYDLDSDPALQYQLSQIVQQADYIIVPSRRVFMNETCFRDDTKELKGAKCDYLRRQYPLINQYYEKLFNGSLGFKKIKKFGSTDEIGEETWTVFDHPTIRIYKKVAKNYSKSISSP